uniref:Uncharacterized protein n=1 Tax=Trichogramma kaykai TaxID=54128 RepID=A0ABD2W240_9HYME
MKDVLAKQTTVCMTADIWNRRFMGVTAHWINPDDFSRKSAALSCKRFPGSHTFDAVAEMLESLHLQFGFTTDKVVGTVTDNGSNFVKAFREFAIDDFEPVVPGEQEMSQDNLEEDHEADEDEVFDVDEMVEPMDLMTYSLPKHYRCASHKLNLLATTDFMKVIDKNSAYKSDYTRVMRKSRLIWKSLKSTKKREEISEYLGCSLQRPVPTGWHSLYDSWKQLHELRHKINSEKMQGICGLREKFTMENFQLIKEYLTFNEPIKKGIDKLQAENNIYYGYFLPTLLTIRQRWQELLQDGSEVELSTIVLEQMIDKLESRFSDFFAI